MHELLEMLYTLEDVKALEPYKWQTVEVIDLESKIRDRARTVRERILRHAIQALASDGIGASFVRNVVWPGLDRSDVKSIVPNPGFDADGYEKHEE
jgi:hypothetical protein